MLLIKHSITSITLFPFLAQAVSSRKKPGQREAVGVASGGEMFVSLDGNVVLAITNEVKRESRRSFAHWR